MFQKEVAKFWENIPYMLNYIYMKKYRYPNLNGYRDNGEIIFKE